VSAVTESTLDPVREAPLPLRVAAGRYEPGAGQRLPNGWAILRRSKRTSAGQLVVDLVGQARLLLTYAGEVEGGAR